MEQLRHLGETLGGVKTLMLFQDEIRVNNRQCRLLADMLSLAFDSVASEMRAHLCFEEKQTKWKTLDNPLRELNRIFKEAEAYIKLCLEPGKDWWANAVALAGNMDCLEVHLHNLLWSLPVVLEAIEYAGEFSGCDEKEIARKKVFFRKKYDTELLDKRLFQYRFSKMLSNSILVIMYLFQKRLLYVAYLGFCFQTSHQPTRFGKLFLDTEDLCKRMETAWKEDMWLLSQAIEERKQNQSKPITKQQARLADVLLGPKGKTHQATVLLNEYQVRRRLGVDSQIKEAQWYGASFAVKHVFGELDPLMQEISLLSSINHPNVLHCLYSFYEEEKKECFILAELMKKDLMSYIKEVCSPNRRLPFPLLVAVDIMLQIARGMEYLHSRKIYHGDLNPANILVKPRSASSDGYLIVKIKGLGLSGSTNTLNTNSCIWYAPEVLSNENTTTDIRCTEKADVYSFAMICFELLTGKVPFEDNHLHGDKMSKNIRASERPLFPFQSPKYLTTLTKKCWQHDPAQRPSFSSICRILRYIKRFLVLNPDHGQPDSLIPPIEYCDIETSILRRNLSLQGKGGYTRVMEVPFQMYAYKVVERVKMNASNKERGTESESDGASFHGDENGLGPLLLHDDTCTLANFSVRSVPATIPEINKKKTISKKLDGKKIKQTGEKQKGKLPPQLQTIRRDLRTKSDMKQVKAALIPSRRRRSDQRSGHASDSEVH
ncbi:Protein kinase family protein [Rhynchospora pubera]|uniref:Protein kinase family protein n=1 Tax=Rhynchospora pubera TaxID=906938 RepID=A0AAV8DPM7_9POAL|nr:Protein kinase family protein [Rhynchospora pubera]